MVLLDGLRQRFALSGLGAVVFASGVVLLFVALYKNASHTASSPLPIVALCVLATAVVCWIAAPQDEEQPSSAFNDLILRPKEFRRRGWNRLLVDPLTLRDGTKIATLRQAATLLMGLRETRKSKPMWQYAAELMLRANKSGKEADVRAATDQLRRALQLEGWM